MAAIKPTLLAIIVCAGFPGALQAQAASDDPVSPPDGVEVHAGYENHRDHFRYTFANPSNIDTDFPVPHTFTQRYVASNQWIFVTGRYAIHDDVMETEFAMTPERQSAGSDLDTFFDPNNDVVVSGTSGDVRLRSLRVTHWSEGRLWGLPWRVGYGFRRDRSQFLPTDRIVTHSNPPSEVHSPTFGRETTISQVHEIPIEISQPYTVFSTWRIVPRGAISPLILARLITKLPDKYPGRDIVFDAKAIGVAGGIEIARQRGWPIALSLHYGQTWVIERRDSTAATFSRRQ